MLHNLRPGFSIGGRLWAAWRMVHQSQAPANLGAEIERELTRLKVAKDQIRSIEVIYQKELVEGKQPMVHDSCVWGRSALAAPGC